jgi:hypothetical protein
MTRTVQRPDVPYLGSRELDDAMLVIAQLVAELWIVKDRVAVLEKLLEDRNVLNTDEVTNHAPDGALAARLDRERDAFVKRVMGAPFNVSSDIESLRSDADVE